MQDNKASLPINSDSPNIRYNILFLTKWYPNKFDPQLAIYVRKHAKAVNAYCNVNVVYACQDDNLKTTFEKIVSTENGFTEITIYYKKSNSILKYFINPYRYFKAIRTGISDVQSGMGQIDLIHVTVLNRPGLVALAIKKLKHIPYIVTEHWTGYASGNYQRKNFIKRWLANRVIKNASAVTTVSENLKQNMLGLGLKNTYYVVPNIIESIAPPPSPNNSKVKILTVSDLLDYKKNISGIIKAVYAVCQQNKNIEYHIIGDGSDMAMLKSLSDSLQMTDKFIFFHGRQDNEYVYEYMKEIDFVVINSNYETFSVAATEALVNGKPVITTICGGPEEFVTEDCGILIEKGNHLQLEEALVKMISTFKNYDPYKLNKYISEKFNYTVIGKQFYNIYKPIITRFTVGLSGKKLNINPEWQVLDVGSGHRPNRRANVLLDNDLDETEHRSGKKAFIPADKKMVVGDALNMPFKDKEFDFIIASHIAEHIDNPEQFCKELSRVGKRGYIETPGSFDEFFLNEPFHKWIVSKKGNCLVFKEKTNFKPFSDFIYGLIYLNENRTGHKPFHSSNPLLKIISKVISKIWKYIPNSYTRFYWEDTINVKEFRKKLPYE